MVGNPCRDTIEKSGDALQVLISVTGLAVAVFYEEGNEGTVQFFKSPATSTVITTLYKGFELSPVASNGVYGISISTRW
jgi:hypothetical protein